MFKHFKQFDNIQDYHDFLITYNESVPLMSLILNEYEVHFENKYRFIDLELPSGTLWARQNIGAKTETDFGSYFAWGDERLRGQYQSFNEYDYKFYNDDISDIDKYTSEDNLTQLRTIDDIVSLLWGQSWHMPTAGQFQELLNTSYCSNEWVTNYLGSGKNGILFTSVANGKTLFFPAAGYFSDNSNNELINENQGVYIWTSILNTTDTSKAQYFNATSSSSSVLSDLYRYYGLSVRGVYEFTY